MKLEILLLFCLSSFCACQIPQKAQIKKLQNSSTDQKAVNKIGDQQTSSDQSEEIDDDRFSVIKIERINNRKYYSLKIDVEYPQVKEIKTLQERNFNQYLEKRVKAQISDFDKFLAEKNKKLKSEIQYEINMDYEIEYFSDTFISVYLDWSGFSGSMHQERFPATINYNLKTGEVVQLRNLFEENSKYLNKIAEASRKILERTCLSCGCGKNIKAGDPLPESLIEESEKMNRNATNANSMVNYQDPLFFEKGTEPNKENYSVWSITPEGLEITFGRYQVGPGCIGIIPISIPFNDLQPILRKDLNFN